MKEITQNAVPLGSEPLIPPGDEAPTAAVPAMALVRAAVTCGVRSLALASLLWSCGEGPSSQIATPQDAGSGHRGPGATASPAGTIERAIVIVIDSTHAAHLGCYGGPSELTPRIDELAQGGMRFDRAFSNNTWTLPSTVSLMTGQLQERHGIITNRHRLGAETTVLPEVFQSAGWRTAAFVEMIYGSGVFGLDRGFDDYNYYSIKAGAHPLTMGNAVVNWMAAHQDEPYLLYVHLRRPHSPYDRNLPVQRRLAPDCPLVDGRDDELLAHADSKVHDGLEPAQAAHVEHLYRGNLAAVDHTVGRLLDQLANDEQALVLLTSDHGEALGQHGHWGHGHSLDAECVDIPLIVAGPGVPAGVDDNPACTVDVLPTLLELCDLPALPGLPGRSFAGRVSASGTLDREREDANQQQPVAFSSAYRAKRIAVQGVILGDLKLVLDRDGGAQLFDRRADRGDTRDVSGEYPEQFERMVRWAQARRELGEALPLSGEETFDVNQEQLRALGYVR
ncbi:MAG: arylsulfatase A-like enzyme [Pseudohongiellaceae bacterium]|jgi:arylsulfatase A-like enzyme